MKGKTPAIVWVAARIFMGLVFAYAGFAKLMEPVENFRGAITQYQVIPAPFISLIAYTLPWLELVFGAFLVLGYLPRLSAFVLASFSAVFLIVLGSSHLLLDSFSASCGCFGQQGLKLSFGQIFALDLADLAFGSVLVRRNKWPWSLHEWLTKTAS